MNVDVCPDDAIYFKEMLARMKVNKPLPLFGCGLFAYS